MTHLLDTSALLAYYLGEPGGTHVRSLLESEKHSVAAFVLVASGFWARLKSLDRQDDFEQEWGLHRPLFAATLKVVWAVSERAITIRHATRERLPTIESLIAATSALHGLVQVHRDPRFRVVDRRLLRQIDLELPSSPA